MTDIHCHIIPGVDDGAGNLDDGLEMARLAQTSGVTHIIATPHCNIPGSFTNRWTPALSARFQTLKQVLKDRGIGVELHAGQEIYLTRQVPELLRGGELITLAGSRYLLVEFGPEETGAIALRKLQQILADVHELLCEGYDADYAELLLRENPRRVIENQPVFGG